jgi:flagellar protein FlgJ
MDINALSAAGLNSAYVPLSSSPASTISGFQASGSFDEILKRTQNAQAGSGVPPAFQKKEPINKTDKSIDKTDKLYELCAELETFLIKNLIKSMRATVQKTNLIDTGFAGEVYEDMLYDEYAKTFSGNANLGFAEMAYRELTKSK